MAFRVLFAATCFAFAWCHCDGFKSVFSWDYLDFDCESVDALAAGITGSDFIPENNLATGIACDADDKLFLTIPRRKDGIPCTVAYVDLKWWAAAGKPSSPKLNCWPSFSAQKTCSCDNIISVNKGVRIDKFDRVIIYDTGKIYTDEKSQQLCPPRIHIFDKNTGAKLHMYTIPDEVSQLCCDPKPIPTALVVDSGNTPSDLHLYIADQKGIISYSFKKDKAWRVSHPFFGYDPLHCNFHIGCFEYRFKYAGVFGMALSGTNSEGDRTLFFHAYASNREFSVLTKILKDESKATDNYFDFSYVGSRGCLGESGAQVCHKTSGVVFQTLPGQNATACWNTAKPYSEHSLHIVAKDDHKMVFPTDLVIDGNDNAWVLSNKMPIYTYGELDRCEPQFHVLKANVNDLVKGTVCA